MERRQLNDIYKKLDKKAHEIGERFHCTFGYYNGHYSKNGLGDYEIDYFPIPVISVKGICDIEIGLDQITVTTKLTREQALYNQFEHVKSYKFEVYGVDNYLDDFYLAGDTIGDMIEKIKESKEQNVFVTFCFPFEASPDELSELVSLISKEGFFY